MNQHLVLLFKGHEGAIGTLIDKYETVETSLDPAMLARTARGSHDEIVARLATDSGNRLILVKHHLGSPEAQLESPRAIAGIGKRQTQGHLFRLLGRHLKYSQAPLAAIQYYVRHPVPGLFQPGK